MTVRDIQEIMDAWAPPDIAWERDNVGLQTGDPGTRIRGILVALDVTEGIAAEAVRRGANLIVSHHPLLFHPLRTVTTGTPGERTLAVARCVSDRESVRGGDTAKGAPASGGEGSEASCNDSDAIHPFRGASLGRERARSGS